MTLGELRTRYSAVHREYNSKKSELSAQRRELEDRMKQAADKTPYQEQAVVLELQYNAVEKQQQVYDDFIQQFMPLWEAKLNETATRQSAEAGQDACAEMGKIMAVARRMCHGDIVPATDEQKLMEYDSDLYQMAKNAQIMAQLKERKRYDSLWEDEEKKEYEDPTEAADSEEVHLNTPEVIAVEDVIANATTPTDS